MKKIVTSVAAALSLLVATSLSFAVEVKTPDIKGAAATATKDTKAAAKGAVVDTKAAAKGAVADTKAAAKTTVTDTKAAAKGAVADTKATAGAAKDKAKAAVAAPAAAAEPIDINTATEAQLKSIPGIGDAYAAKIIAGRPYTNKAQLKSKNIIPEQAYDKVKDAIVAKKPAKGKKK